MKIVLVNPNFSGFTTVEPPLTLASIQAVCDEHKVAIVEAHALDYNIRETCAAIMKESPDVVGITSTTPQITDVVKITKRLKETDGGVYTVVGGSHATVLPEAVLNSGYVDIVVRGEGEITFRNLLNTISNEGDLKKVNGISWIKKPKTHKKNQTIVHNPPQSLIEDLDSLPFPNWDGFPIEKYNNPRRRHHPFLLIMTSRGCPFQCSYCFQQIFGKKYRFMSAKRIVDEIEYLIERYRIKEYTIIDDNFSLYENRVTEFCDELERRKIDIPWTCGNGIRVDMITNELLIKMKKTGCYAVSFGVESGSQRILDDIQKKISLQETRNAIALAKKHKMETQCFILIGLPHETVEDIKSTVSFVKELNPDWCMFSMAVPYPGTPMWEEIKEKGKFYFNDWSELDRYAGRSYFELGTKKEEIEKAYMQAIFDFYLSPKYLFKTLIMRPKAFFNMNRMLWSSQRFLNAIRKYIFG